MTTPPTVAVLAGFDRPAATDFLARYLGSVAIPGALSVPITLDDGGTVLITREAARWWCVGAGRTAQ